MWDNPDDDPTHEEGEDSIGAAVLESWAEQTRQLRTPSGIHAMLQNDDYGGTMGPNHLHWRRAANLLVEDIAETTFDLARGQGPEGPETEGPKTDRLGWQRAAWAFTWPLADATPERASTPCQIRIWTSPGIPEDYQSLHGSGHSDTVVELGARVAALRTWDTTEPWNTYLVLIQRDGMDTYNERDCAWWQSRPADYFAKPEAIVAALAGIFPAKGWSLTASDR